MRNRLLSAFTILLLILLSAIVFSGRHPEAPNPLTGTSKPVIGTFVGASAGLLLIEPRAGRGSPKLPNITFAIDPGTGKLKPTGASVEVGSPVCIKFVTP